MTTTVAVDLAQTVFERAITDDQGRLAERQRLSREAFARFFAHRPPGRIVMDACATAHHGARTFQAQGHTVKLLPPPQVRPDVRRNKTDRADAAALLEADRCPAILAAPVKSEAPQGLQGLHRVRSAWMAMRTDRINTLRGLRREFGRVLAARPGGGHGSRKSASWRRASPTSKNNCAPQSSHGPTCNGGGRCPASAS